VKRESRAEFDRLWAVVAATVRPLPGRLAPQAYCPSPALKGQDAPKVESRVQAADLPIAMRLSDRPGGPGAIEPGRRRRLASERDQIAARIDLHGLTQDGARSALTAFVIGRFQQGHRSVLVITGKGAMGDGVLRRRVPEWLAEPPLRAMVAGLSEAHRRHGGAGALYVALKRQSPG
jgi:DNA-nicking Smr family endonuclease